MMISVNGAERWMEEKKMSNLGMVLGLIIGVAYTVGAFAWLAAKGEK